MGRVTRSSTRKAASPPAKKAEEAKPPKKAAKKLTKPKAATAATAKEDVKVEVEPSTSGKKVVTIEACKQWGAFKSRAAKIQKAVGKKATVEINKEKPGRGNFVVRVSGVEEPIVELLSLKRPFPPLKALDMEEISNKVISAIEA
jgi:translation initiation factor 1 (eIF-1/SUI1)